MINFLSANPSNSKGRLFKELEGETSRTSFERDRDRIIHSSAFRKRIELKSIVIIFRLFSK